MSWNWVVKQLQGERTVLKKTGGRLVINMGLNGKAAKPVRTDLRKLVIETLTDVGELSTQELFEHVCEADIEINKEGLYSVLRKMMAKGQVQMRNVPRPDNFGKGMSLWKV
jgi:selenophosphate synthetase-related protein